MKISNFYKELKKKKNLYKLYFYFIYLEFIYGTFKVSVTIIFWVEMAKKNSEICMPLMFLFFITYYQFFEINEKTVGIFVR
jgi:hypothetical protein